jgi:hypothetical protein
MKNRVATEDNKDRIFKTDEGTKIAKARLVALGYEEDVTNEPVDAPTGTKEGMRIVMFMCVQRGWEIKQRDATRAFLQSDDRTSKEKDVFIIPPKGVENSDDVWLLKKSLYGLRSAPKAWWKTITNCLLENGLTQIKFDKALFVLKEGKRLLGLIHIHVDDFTYGGNRMFYYVLAFVWRKIKFDDEVSMYFVHLGIEVKQDEKTMEIKLSQQHKIKKLEEIKISGSRRNEITENVTETEKDDMRSVIGSMLYIACQTRPEISTNVSFLSGSCANKVEHISISDTGQSLQVGILISSTSLHRHCNYLNFSCFPAGN